MNDQRAHVKAPPDLRVHLMEPLDHDGHFLTEDTLAIYTDHQQVHEEDHRPGSWWSEALMHDHDTDGGS